MNKRNILAVICTALCLAGVGYGLHLLWGLTQSPLHIPEPALDALLFALCCALALMIAFTIFTAVGEWERKQTTKISLTPSEERHLRKLLNNYAKTLKQQKRALENMLDTIKQLNNGKTLKAKLRKFGGVLATGLKRVSAPLLLLVDEAIKLFGT